jgi:pre-mRNA-splicing factor RBM22/SLT11
VCLFDLDYGLPVQVRDTALGIEKEDIPESDVGKEFQLNEQIQRGQTESAFGGGGAGGAGGGAGPGGNDMLMRLARTTPYYKVCCVCWVRECCVLGVAAVCRQLVCGCQRMRLRSCADD